MLDSPRILSLLLNSYNKFHITLTLMYDPLNILRKQFEDIEMLFVYFILEYSF